MEYAQSSQAARAECALCQQNVLNADGDFNVYVQNEGSSSSSIDFGQLIDEEIYLTANPALRRKNDFLSLMSQMEFKPAELFLKGEYEGFEGKGIDPNVCYEGGKMTAMHMAALNDDVEGVKLLLQYGADKNFKAEDGQTALDMAKGQWYDRIVALLAG